MAEYTVGIAQTTIKYIVTQIEESIENTLLVLDIETQSYLATRLSTVNVQFSLWSSLSKIFTWSLGTHKGFSSLTIGLYKFLLASSFN